MSNSNITFFFRFVNKRASYPFGIISLAHAPVTVTARKCCQDCYQHGCLCSLAVASITLSTCLYCACWVCHLTLVLHCQYVYTVLVESSNIGNTLSICLYCTCWVCHLTLVLHCQYVYTLLVESSNIVGVKHNNPNFNFILS